MTTLSRLPVLWDLVQWSGAIVYTESIAVPTGVPLFPVQAVEAVGNLVIAAVLCLYGKICSEDFNVRLRREGVDGVFPAV